MTPRLGAKAKSARVAEVLPAGGSAEAALLPVAASLPTAPAWLAVAAATGSAVAAALLRCCGPQQAAHLRCKDEQVVPEALRAWIMLCGAVRIFQRAQIAEARVRLNIFWRADDGCGALGMIRMQAWGASDRFDIAQLSCESRWAHASHASGLVQMQGGTSAGLLKGMKH